MKLKIRGLIIIVMCITVLVSCKKQDEVSSVNNKVEDLVESDYKVNNSSQDKVEKKE